MMLLCALLMALGCQIEAAQIAFQLADEWTVSGIETGRWRAIRLSGEPKEKLNVTRELSGEARYGVLEVGLGDDRGRAVLLDYSKTKRILYLDVDDDGHFGPGERCAAVEKDLWEARLTPSGLQEARTFRFRLGAGGRVLLYAVRGCRVGKLPTKLGLRPALLLDMNGDCAYDTKGRDQLCVDLDGDGRFDPITERAPLLPSVHIGEEEFTLKVSPSGDTVDIALRDRPPGRLVATIPLKEGKVKSALVTLTRDDGLPLALRELGKPVELPEGTYHLAGADIWVTDNVGQAWHFPFEFFGERQCEFKVQRDAQTDVSLLSPLMCKLSISGKLAPGGDLSVTVNIVSAEGLQLGAASKGEGRDAVISSKVWLIAPEGQILAHDDAGYG